MENVKTLTPIQLWQDYNPIKDPLEINIISRKVDGEIEKTEYAFTVYSALDGRIRTFATVTKRRDVNNAPVLLYIPDFYEVGAKNFKQAVLDGFAVVEYDYSGKLQGKKRYCTYPKSLFYGNITEAGERLNTATYGARETSLHLWTLVSRRVLTLIGTISGLDATRVTALAWGDGAGILWQVAGVDGRINTIVPLLNCGYSEYAGYDKYGNSPVPQYDEERTRWNTGCSVQAYAKFVSSDVFCIVASNDKRYSMDRMWDTMSLINPLNKHTELVCFGLQGQVYHSAKVAFYQYLKDKFLDNRPLAIAPTFALRVEEGKLVCDVTCDSQYDNIVSVDAYYAYGEARAPYRNWINQSLGIDIQGKAKANLRVWDVNQRTFCMVNVTYKNGMKISSEMKVITPREIGEIKPSVRATRIIYEKKMGIKAFSPETNSHSVEDDAIVMAIGPLDISGVTTKSGNLLNYNIGDVKCEEEESLLQIDLFSATKNKVALSLLDINGKEYRVNISILDKAGWTRAQLSPSDFKDIGLISLKEWKDIKCLIINNAEDIMVNNIIWV